MQVLPEIKLSKQWQLSTIEIVGQKGQSVGGLILPIARSCTEFLLGIGKFTVGLFLCTTFTFLGPSVQQQIREIYNLKNVMLMLNTGSLND